MARRVFFSFHYKRDGWRVAQVRNSWVTKPDKEAAGYIDAASWEELERQGDEAIKRWINNQLTGTSVTVVLIGAQTAQRKWVKYEIIESRDNKKNGLLGICIHNIRDQNNYRDSKGENPFDKLYDKETGKPLSALYNTYDWVNDDGYNNMGIWVEKAASQIGR